jgi:hypothetical protein
LAAQIYDDQRHDRGAQPCGASNGGGPSQLQSARRVAAIAELTLGAMKVFRGKFILISTLVAGVSALFIWGASTRRSDVDQETLGRDFVLVEWTNGVWRASMPERIGHYVRHWGQRYSCTGVRPDALTNVALIYSVWAARPVYVQHEIASLDIGQSQCLHIHMRALFAG